MAVGGRLWPSVGFIVWCELGFSHNDHGALCAFHNASSEFLILHTYEYRYRRTTQTPINANEVVWSW